MTRKNGEPASFKHKLDRDISRPVALISGGSRGIGRSVALGLAKDGFDIAIIFNSNVEAASRTVEMTAALGATAKAYQADVSVDEQTKDAVAKVMADFGSVWALINAAGITQDGLFVRMGDESFERVLNVNLKGTFHTMRACTRGFIRQHKGRIVNLGSVVGISGNAGQANYAASKAGLIALAKSIAQELGSRGIRANAIAPGFILTDMTAALSDEVRAEWAKKIPLRRGGTPDDVANIATFLASDMSSYVSGQVIQVDGGMNM